MQLLVDTSPMAMTLYCSRGRYAVLAANSYPLLDKDVQPQPVVMYIERWPAVPPLLINIWSPYQHIVDYLW